jgi:hypothetical protein
LGTPSDFEKRSRSNRWLEKTCPHRVCVDQAFSIGTSFRFVRGAFIAKTVPAGDREPK